VAEQRAQSRIRRRAWKLRRDLVPSAKEFPCLRPRAAPAGPNERPRSHTTQRSQPLHRNPWESGNARGPLVFSVRSAVSWFPGLLSPCLLRRPRAFASRNFSAELRLPVLLSGCLPRRPLSGRISPQIKDSGWDPSQIIALGRIPIDSANGNPWLPAPLRYPLGARSLSRKSCSFWA